MKYGLCFRNKHIIQKYNINMITPYVSRDWPMLTTPSLGALPPRSPPPSETSPLGALHLRRPPPSEPSPFGDLLSPTPHPRKPPSSETSPMSL